MTSSFFSVQTISLPLLTPYLPSVTIFDPNSYIFGQTKHIGRHINAIDNHR